MDDEEQAAFDGQRAVLHTLEREIGELGKKVSQSRPKDKWDKAAVLVSGLASVVAATVAGFVSCSVSAGAHKLQLAQLDLSEKQAKSAEKQRKADIDIAQAGADTSRRADANRYLDSIASATDANGRAALIGLVDVAIPDRQYFIQAACQYAKYDSVDVVRNRAMEVLSQYSEGRTCLESFVRTTKDEPARTFATTALKANKDVVRIRISNIDDIGRVELNGQHVLYTVLPNESGWVDITKGLRQGENKMTFTVINGPYGGWSFQFEISAGLKTYDSGLQGQQNSCPCDKPVMALDFTLTVAVDGTVALAGPNERKFPM